MKKINEINKQKIFIIFVSIIISSIVVAYIIQNYIDSFFSLVILLSSIFVFIFLSILSVLKRKDKEILHDIKQISNYLDELSNKNYEAIVKTQYFSEFLHISVKLKNIVKRLYKKKS